jgi:GT2 family glycosyltransferase
LTAAASSGPGGSGLAPGARVRPTRDTSPSTSVVLVVFNQLSLTQACLESLRPTITPFELCVVDNGSTDGTPAFFRELAASSPLTYQRNDANVGLIRALNQGARLGRGETLCFLHNDVEMRDPRWLGRLRAALESPLGIGLAGLYGARRLRADGRYAGRTLLHCLADGGTLTADLAEVAAVDGVCLCLRRDVLEAVGGFDEGYGFFHGYDRDLSFAVREAGWRCAVVNAPFIHRGGGTRTGEGAPVGRAADLAQRREALRRFVAKWRHRLPCDVRSARERWGDWLGPTRGRA